MDNIKYTMQEHFERYEEVYREFKKFFNMNSMQEQFDDKADHRDINKL